MSFKTGSHKFTTPKDWYGNKEFQTDSQAEKLNKVLFESLQPIEPSSLKFSYPKILPSHILLILDCVENGSL